MFSPLAGTISQSLRQSTSGDSKIYAILSSEASTLWNLSVQWQSWELVSFTDGTYSVISVITQLAWPEVDSPAEASNGNRHFRLSNGLTTLLNDRIDVSPVAPRWPKKQPLWAVTRLCLCICWMDSCNTGVCLVTFRVWGFVHQDWPRRNEIVTNLSPSQ